MNDEQNEQNERFGMPAIQLRPLLLRSRQA